MLEVRVLEYWRKRYVKQAVIVAVLAGSSAGAGVFFAPYFLVKVLALSLGFVFFYVMFKAIKDDFQARFEGALLMDAVLKFPTLSFDIGRGNGEDALLSQSVCPAYSVYECFNVISGQNFSFEEVQLLEDIRFLGFALPVFDGVILRLNTTKDLSPAQGTVKFFNKKLIFTGETAPLLQELKSEVASLLQHFAVKEAKVCVDNSKVYFWLDKAQKLYRQTKLFSYNPPSLFDKKIEALQTTAKALADKF
ncbi:MAG: hypothetical protein J6B00_01180 [Alphaproteobacteria bacterium]|nr:hypothetical protein [Alphaproteobacteria bacterium]